MYKTKYYIKNNRPKLVIPVSITVTTKNRYKLKLNRRKETKFRAKIKHTGNRK